MSFHRLRLAVMTIAVAAAVASLVAQGGRFSTTLDLFTHLAPLYLAAGLAAGLVELLTARRGATLAAAAVAVIGAAALMGPEILRPAPASAAGLDLDRRLTLIQFNAQRANRRYAEMVDWIVAQQPDAVLVEEATPELRDHLLKRTGWHVVGRLTTVMIFSPHPLTGIGVRPVAPSLGAPTWVNARMEASPWGSVPLLAVHVPWPTDDLDDRVRPIMAGVVAALGRDSLILAGDFNSTPWSFARRHQDQAYGLRRVTQAVPTWPTAAGPLAAFPIDHVYIGSDWRLVSLGRGPELGSDHFPLLVRIAPAGDRRRPS